MTQIGTVYGKALYDLARAEGLSDTIGQELSALDQSFTQEPGFLRLLTVSNLSKEERCGILSGCFQEKIHPYVLNFLKILTEKGYAGHFSHCCKVYHHHYHQDNGILTVQAITAIPLTEEQSARLIGKLEKATQKAIELRNRVDPTVLGGICLGYDGKRLDNTVSHRLESIRSMLSGSVL